MNFRLYPLDLQTCNIELESSKNNVLNQMNNLIILLFEGILPVEKLCLKWSELEPFDLTRNFSWDSFFLTNYSLSSTSMEYLQTGSFSKLVVTFILEREFGHYFLDIYCPSIMFVITSWLSFWIEIPAAPARVALGKMNYYMSKNLKWTFIFQINKKK